MKNVLRKPIAIALTTLVLAGQTGVSSMVAFAAEEANTNGTQGIQGRAGVTVNVGTATELRNAMTNASVTDIYITANITLPAANVQGKGSKHIYGQGYTVDFANGNIYGDYNSVNTAQDLTIRNAGTYGGFFGGTGYSENTYKDVHFTGATQIMFNAGYAKLTLEGNITVDSTVSEAIYASNVTVKSGADVDISSTKSAIYIEQNKVNALPSALTTEAGSSLLVHSKTGHAFFGARLAAAAVTLGGDANFISDATYAYYDEAAYYNQAASKALDLLPGSDTLILGGQSSKYTAFYGDLNIRDNADIFIQAYSTTEAAAIFANKGLVAAPDANFRIVSASGNAIGGKVSSGTSKVVLQSTIGLSTWNLTTPSNSKPTNEYQFSKAEFSLLGWAPSVITASNVNSDSAAFNTSFNPNLVREIAYGSYSTLADKEKELVEAAETSVKDLFNNGDVNGTIKDTTDQAAIDKAQEAINKVTDPAKKADLQKNLDEAQKQLNDRDNAAAEKARQEAAETSVNDLFNNGDVEGTIKDTTDQAAIDKAQEAINKVTDPAKKADLQKNLDEAQKQLNDRDNAAAEKARQEAAETSVNDLFNNGDVEGTIKDTTDQAAIDKAQEAINKVTDPAKKAELQKELDKAQQQLNDRNSAAEAINGKGATYTLGDLYITGTYTGPATGMSIDVNGKRYYGGTAIDGTLKFYGLDKIFKVDDEVIINLYGADKQIKQSFPLQIVEPLQVNVVDYKVGDNYINATYNNSNVAKVGVVVDGKKYWGGDVANGKVKFYALDKISSADAVATMNFYDAENNLLATKKIKIAATYAGEVTTATLKLTDTNIRGTVTGDIKQVAISINGKMYYGGAVLADGTYRFYSLDKKITTTDEVIVYGYGPDNKKLAEKVVTISE